MTKRICQKKCQDCIFDNLEEVDQKKIFTSRLKKFENWKTDHSWKWYEKDIDQSGR